jgi:hypothetical protein
LALSSQKCWPYTHWSWVRVSYYHPRMFPWHKPPLFGFWWRSFIGQKSMGVSILILMILSESLLLLTPHMFFWHKLHYLVFGDDHLSGKNLYTLAFSINENSCSRHFRPKMLAICPLIVTESLILKMLAICPLIVTESLILLNPHMFLWHKPYYLVFGRDN